MSDLVRISNLMKNHLYRLAENIPLDTWTIQSSPVEGRGIFASKDLHPGDVIFIDHPLISGPRVRRDVPVGCIVCHTLVKPLKKCSDGCGTMVCSDECQTDKKHHKECGLLRSWKTVKDSLTVDSEDLVRNIVPLRSLLLDGPQKEILMNLAAHKSPMHGAEVNFFKKHFCISQEEESVMLHACCVLDANAYEMLMETDEECIDLRGLFPMSALLNHTCSPNTRSSFNSKGLMRVIATKYIPEASEIFTSYTKLLWATPTRRQHLLKTKHFTCDCFRCCDKSEFGTNLAALRCLDRKCDGLILPEDPLSFNSFWSCNNCKVSINPNQVGTLQSAIAGMLRTASLNSPDDIDDFLTHHLLKFLPESNYIALELKCQIVWCAGDAEGFGWKEISATWLSRVEALCRGALKTCEDLHLGAAPLSARLHLRLHSALLEKLCRLQKDTIVADEQEILDMKKEIVYHINKSYEILKGDVLAPKDLEERNNLANEDVQSLLNHRENIQ